MEVLEINTLDNKGGAAKVAYKIKEGLVKRGHSASMFVAKKHTDDSDVFYIQKQNFLFRLIKKVTGRDAGRFLRERIQRVFPSDISFFNVRNLFKSDRYKDADIVHLHNLSADYFNLSALKKISKKKKTIWTLHDMWAITYGAVHTYADIVEDGFFQVPDDKLDLLGPGTQKKLSIKNYLENKKRNVYEHSDFHIVVPSNWLKEKVERSVLKGKPITLIHNGIDHTVFKPVPKKEAREKLGLPQDKKIVLFLADGAEASKLKGWQFAEKVTQHFKDRDDIIFLSIGRRGNRKKSEDTHQIRYIDYIESEETLAEYYSASDAFLFTSPGENFPLVILEAMACGLPIVSFDVGGVKEALIHKEHGYIAEHLNSDQLIEGLDYIFNLSEETVREMGENSRKRVTENFTLDIMVQNYIELYEKFYNQS